MISGSSSADMSNFKKNNRFKTYFVFPLFMLFIVLACENDMETIRSFSPEEKMPLQTQYNSEIVYTDSGRVQIKIFSPEVNNYPNVEKPYLEMPDGLHVLFYDSEGNVESELSAGYATYYIEDRLWEVRDSVVVVNKLGEVLNTEQLFWDENRHLIYSEKFVKITRTNEIIMGEGLEANQNLTKWKITTIQGTIYIDDDE